MEAPMLGIAAYEELHSGKQPLRGQWRRNVDRDGAGVRRLRRRCQRAAEKRQWRRELRIHRPVGNV